MATYNDNLHVDDETLLRYRYETLEAEPSAEVASHLRRCTECATRFAEIGRGIDRLKAYDTEGELDEGLGERVLQRVRQRREEQDLERTRREAEQARQEAERMRDDAERARRDAEQAVAAATSLAAEEPVERMRPQAEEKPRLGFWAWLGFAAGGTLRPVRAVASLAVLLGTAYIAGGALYYSTRTAAIDTRVSGEETMQPGARGLVLVEVFNRLTRQPMAHADVRIALRAKDRSYKLFEGRTDNSGAINAPLQMPDLNDGQYQLEVTSRAKGETDRVTHPIFFHRAFKVHLSTDKPLYQPGQTVHIRTLVLERPRLVPPAGKPVVIDVFDPKGNRLTRQAVAVSRFGVGAYSLELSDDVALGSYRIRAVVEGTASEMEVKVARYTLPKFKITIEPEKSFYLAGETLRAKVVARYFFGKPVQRGDLRVVLFRSDGAVLGEEQKGKTGPGGEYQLSAELPTDLATSGSPQTVMMEVAVKDTAGQEERKQQGVMVSRDLLVMEVVPEGGKLISDMENTFYVLTTTPDGKPTTARVEVSLPGGKTVNVRTHANGLGTFSFVPRVGDLRGGWVTPSPDIDRRVGGPRHWRTRRPMPRPIYSTERALQLELKGEDSTGRRASRQVSIPAELAQLLVATDRAFYRPGETAKIGIQAIPQFTAALVEAVREGQTVLRARATLSGGKGTAELDLPAGVTGTLRLDVLAVDPYDVRTPAISRQIVIAEPQGLTVKASADQASYRAGGQAKLRFKVTDAQGQPKAAAIGLTIVDESVFALAASRPALARAYFLLERTLMEPRYNLSAAEVLSGGSWGEAEQQAGRLLFSLGGDRKPLHRFFEETYEAKIASLTAARAEFEANAVTAGIGIGLVLLVVLLVTAARRLPAWAGGILLGLAGAVALLIPVELTLVIGGLVVGVALALAVYGQRTRKVGWAYLIIPAVGVIVVSAVMVPQQRAPERWGTERPTSSSWSWLGKQASAPRVPTGGFGDMLRGGKETNLDRRREEAKVGATAAPGPMEPMLEAPRAVARKMARATGTLGVLGGAGRGGGGDDGEGTDKSKLAKDAAAIPRREVRMRQYFPETMYVHPELVADEKGEAELKIPLADSITEWRISALASSADGKLGAVDQPLKVFQDFFVDLDTPVALVRGDEATIPIAIYNYLSEEQTVRLEVKREPWFELLGKAQLAVKLASGGVDGRDLRIRVLQTGRHKLSLRADGTRMSDAVARELLISEAGQERSDSVSGTLTPGETVRVTVQVPDAATKGSSRLTVKLFPSRIASALDGLENAVQMPHGCFEQTSSATYPNVLIYDYLKRAGKLTPEFKQRATRYISLGYQRLLRYEIAGGGFEWFGRAPANQVLTAYGLMEFQDMSRVFPVDEAVIQRTQRWLIGRQQSDGTWSPDGHSLSDGLWRSGYAGQQMVTAYIAWALAESGYRGSALDRALSSLSSNVASMDDAYTLALTVAAMAKAKHQGVGAAATALAARAQRRDKEVTFSPAAATVYYGRGVGGNVETTALAVYALMLAGKEPALVQGGLNVIASSRDYRGTWHSTQGTILALRALLAGTAADTDQQVSVRINGQDAGTFALKATSEVPQLVELGPRARQGANVVELRGQTGSPFQVIATYTLPWREKGSDDDKPLQLKVEYGRAKVDLGGIVPVDVSLTYRKPEASGMALLALGLAPGLTPITEDLEALKSGGQIARYEVEAGKVNFYIDRLTTGATVQLKLRLKARSKVKTGGASSVAYLYYHPEVRASAAPTPMVVN
jgi:hypothetical protein